MQLPYPHGAAFHGEFDSADAHAPGSESAARMTLFGAYQTSPALPTGLTLGTTDIVIITDIAVNVGASGLVVQVFDGGAASPGAGNLIAKYTLAANGTANWSRHVGHYCQKGSYPKVLTSAAGQVDVLISGFIYTPSS